MKNFRIALTIIILFGTVTCALADDLGLGESAPSVENAWYGQKQITDEDFEKTIKRLEEKKNKSGKKKLKGQSLNTKEEECNVINELTDKTLLLTLPVELITESGQEIPTGHYNIVGRKQKNKIYLDFRQSHSLIATVEAYETDSDFGESSINFVKLRPYDETKVKIIYGSIEFNATLFVNIKNSLKD